MVEREDYSNLDDLKKEYENFKIKYELPGFSDLNRVFDIEEIDVDSEFLLRKIRRMLSERIAGYLRFIEIVLNPSNAPMFFFTMIKKLDDCDKEDLSNIYDVLSKFEMKILILDIDYSEEKEAKFIKNIFSVFEDEIKAKLLKIIKKMNNGGKDAKKSNDGSYVG